MPPKKKKKAPDLNPITGQAPNTFTAVTNRTLPPVRNVREAKLNENDRRRVRSMATAMERDPNSPMDAPLGYRQPAGMDSNSFAWLMGAHRVFHDLPEGGAINEPHEAEAGVTVQRRAEDLGRREYKVGEDALRAGGHEPRNPTESLVGLQKRNLARVLGEHAAAGVNESASQKFYGGTISTSISDPELHAAHVEQVLAAPRRLAQAAQELMDHPEFQARTAHLDPASQHQLARHITASAIADTSPNNKYREGSSWPNIEQASEANAAGIEGREGRFIAGRIQNVEKAAGRADEQVIKTASYRKDVQGWAPTVHEYGDPISAAKTIAFRGALVNRNSPDAMRVMDIHEGAQAFPWLPTGKSDMYEVPDPDPESKTGRIGSKIALFPDQTERSLPKGAVPVMKDVTTDAMRARGETKLKHDKGNSRVEEVISKGQPYIHAINDYAARRALAEAGVSRGVNYADHNHEFQAATWGSQQVKRSDVTVSHADQYPVVRDWAAEGSDNLTDAGRSLFGSRTGVGTQWTRNPNTSFAGDPLREKPYPVMGDGPATPAARPRRGRKT